MRCRSSSHPVVARCPKGVAAHADAAPLRRPQREEVLEQVGRPEQVLRVGDAVLRDHEAVAVAPHEARLWVGPVPRLVRLEERDEAGGRDAAAGAGVLDLLGRQAGPDPCSQLRV